MRDAVTRQPSWLFIPKVNGLLGGGSSGSVIDDCRANSYDQTGGRGGGMQSKRTRQEEESRTEEGIDIML